MDILGAIIGALGLIGGAIGFFVARSASKTADAAQRQATEALTRSATAAEEAAAALVRANEIAEAMIPVKKTHFAVGPVKGNIWAVYCDGDVGAANVQLHGVGDEPGLIRPNETEPRDLIVGDSMQFSVLRVSSPAIPRLRIEWDAPNGDRLHQEVNIN